MKNILATAAVAALSLGVAATCVGAQSEPPRPDVEWVVPPAPPLQKQSDAEAARGMKIGRALPDREVLQPQLDEALPAYAKTSVHLSGTYKAAASDVLPGISKAWAKAFEAMYPDVRISVDPPYAGSLGAVELAKGKLDFVFVSRELRPDDITAFHAKFGYDPLSVPIMGGTYRHFGFLDAVGFIVNKANPIEQLSYEQLDAAFSKTQARGGKAATTWGDLGLSGDWADKPIHLVGVKPWNGFEEFVRQRVLSVPGKRGEWRDGMDFSPNVFPIAGKVAADKYAIAYDGLAYLSDPVKVIAVGPGNALVAPTYENVANASYPLSRLVYFNVNKTPGKALPPAIGEFLRFILSRQGQALVRDQGVYLPLRARQVATARAMLAP